MTDQPVINGWPDLVRRAVEWATARNVKFGVLLKFDRKEKP